MIKRLLIGVMVAAAAIFFIIKPADAAVVASSSKSIFCARQQNCGADFSFSFNLAGWTDITGFNLTTDNPGIGYSLMVGDPGTTHNFDGTNFTFNGGWWAIATTTLSPGSHQLNFSVNGTPNQSTFYPVDGNLTITGIEIIGGAGTAPPPSVDIIRPENGTSTQNPAFSGDFWGVDISNITDFDCSSGTPCLGAIHFWYGTSTEQQTAGIIFKNFTQIATTNDQIKYFGKTYDLVNGEHSAQFWLYNGLNDTDPIIATSTQINFTITSSTYPVGVTGTSTIADTTIECNSGNWWQDGFCGAISFLFYPPQGVLDSFANLKDDIKNKPPIGYLTLITASISDIGEGSSPLTLINASTTDAFSDIFDPVRSGLTWLLWFLFAFWLFNRIRHLEI